MDLFCIECKKKISANQKKCGACGAPFSFLTEYIDYSPNNNFYWGEIGQEEIQELNKRSREIGYRRACFEHFKNHPRKDLFEYILNETGRTAFINFIYRKSRSKRCLDLGSGLGAIPAGLSKLFEEVYSIELVRERVEFQTIRKNQDGIKNWKIMKGSVDRLPFPDDYFDFVSANGMLEWAAVADFTDSPRNVQLNFIKEIRRVLKPEGVGYVGIENRTGVQYFRGALDHSGIPYTSLMPRFLANISCYSKQKKDNFHFDKAQKAIGAKYYRVYTYTKNQYKKLLKEADIENVRLFHTNFTYNLAYAGIDDRAVSAIPSGKDIIKTKLTQFKHATNRLRAWFFSLLTPNFLIFFSKQDPLMTSDLEEGVKKKHSDPGPYFVYRGFNSLLAYSIPRETFYKTPSIVSSEIKSEPKVAGEIPKAMNPELFEQTLQILKRDYHTKLSASPEKLSQFTDWIKERAERYGLADERLASYLADLQKKYTRSPLFSRNHGDVWQGNIMAHEGVVRLIDEERDAFNLLPLELMRFLLSVTGYRTQDKKKSDYLRYMQEILTLYKGLVTQEMLEDFYISTLWYELSRRDLFEDSPRKELYYFYDALNEAMYTANKEQEKNRL